MSQDDEKLLDHNYDGIQELDNPLPSWWLASFLVAIIFSFFYWIHYEFSGGQTQWQELEHDLAMIEQAKKNRPVKEVNDDDVKQLLASAVVLKEGQEVYVSKCGACHGPELQGMIGPNLTDEYWLHGNGRFRDLVHVIRVGVLEKGMPAWGEQLKENELQSVATYITQKYGSNPPNAKGPQGEKVGNL